MMEGPLVSVIVPVYGVEQYIGRCAASLFQQTYQNIEFIFVDDGSPDRSVDVLQSELDKCDDDLRSRVRIIRKENEGLPKARQSGMEASRGDYILHVDSDDYLERDAVEALVDKALESDADIVVFDFWKEYRRYSKIDSEKDSSIADSALFRKRLYTYASYGYVWNKFYRREVCENLYYPDYSMHEDIVFNTQALYRAKKLVHLKRPLYHYNRTNLSSATRVPQALRRSRSARNMLDFYLHFKDSADSPLTGVEDEIILRAAWVAFTKDKTIFRDYPFLRSLAQSFPLKCGRFVSLPEQLLLKLYLKLS